MGKLSIWLCASRRVWLPDSVSSAGRKDALIWEENGITYSIITDSLPLEELMKVANSLSLYSTLVISEGFPRICLLERMEIV